ncbi:PREDICTED: uncharacterized protein LOC104813254 [Tarenaya hassleriana]|uniref:uncharacterized protein LOC104813254 n=1 Tax=Tarenaya hassleriana TaxID=28532 RepID=UPI00053C24A3|nr:PREDICTED: uncharacterized protein LOC104813254 [Tarenaya hassleriana]
MGTTRSEVNHLVAAAIKLASAIRPADDPKNTTHIARFIHVLKQIKGLSLSAESLRSSAVQKLQGLKNHRSQKIRTEILEMFEAANKSADAANVKGILLGQAETSRCVETMSKLTAFSVRRKVLEENRLVEKLQHLTKHKNRKIRSAASHLLHHWSERTTDQEQKDSALKKNPDCKAVQTRPSPPTQMKKKKLQQNDPMEVSGKPRESAVERVENKREGSMERSDVLEVFEIAKKAADAANVKGMLLGESEALRCVDALSKLKTLPVEMGIAEANRLKKRLENLTKHNNRRIRSSATALLRHWRIQRTAVP